MSSMKKQKPVAHTEDDPKIMQTPEGAVMYYEHEMFGGDKARTYRQEEMTLEQQTQITGLLLECGIEKVMSFNDVSTTPMVELQSALMRNNGQQRILEILLTVDGKPLEAGHFDGWRAAPFNQLFSEVMARFFILNPSLLTGTPGLLTVFMGLVGAMVGVVPPTMTSSTPSVMET